jgi:hypothetical protein
MKIEILITQDRYSKNPSSFGSSFVNLINNEYSLKKVIEDNPNEIETIINNEFKEDIELVIPNHLTINKDLALKLSLLDSLDCSCLEAKSTLGEVLKNIMIDNFQLVLTRKHWHEADNILLYFDAVEYGCVEEFMNKRTKNKKSKKIS